MCEEHFQPGSREENARALICLAALLKKNRQIASTV